MSSSCQLVNLFDKGEPVRMSKRAGTFVTLRDVVDEVGNDVVRFIMLTRKNDQPLDFDFAKVTEQSKDNPVFYVQYAHARAASVMRHAAEQFPEDDLADAALGEAPLERLCDPSEIALIRQLAGWPRLVEAPPRRTSRTASPSISRKSRRSSTRCGTRARTRRLCALSSPADPELTRARLALVRGVAHRHRFGARRVRRRAGAGDVTMSYQLGSVDPGRGGPSSTPTRGSDERGRAFAGWSQLWLRSLSWGCLPVVCGSPTCRDYSTAAAIAGAAMSR